MAVTYKLIETVTVGSGGAASIEFGSIPQTYTDLVVHLSARTSYSGVGDDLFMYFNGLTTNRTSRFLYGNGSSALSGSSPADHAGTMTSNTATASVFGSATIYIPNYTGSTNKSFSGDSVSENNSTTAYQDFTAGLWSSTAAITSIQIPTAGGRGVWMQYTSASLYGIKNS